MHLTSLRYIYVYIYECIYIYIFCLSKLNIFISSLGMANAHKMWTHHPTPALRETFLLKHRSLAHLQNPSQDRSPDSHAHRIGVGVTDRTRRTPPPTPGRGSPPGLLTHAGVPPPGEHDLSCLRFASEHFSPMRHVSSTWKPGLPCDSRLSVRAPLWTQPPW